MYSPAYTTTSSEYNAFHESVTSNSLIGGCKRDVNSKNYTHNSAFHQKIGDIHASVNNNNSFYNPSKEENRWVIDDVLKRVYGDRGYECSFDTDEVIDCFIKLRESEMNDQNNISKRELHDNNLGVQRQQIQYFTNQLSSTPTRFNEESSGVTIILDSDSDCSEFEAGQEGYDTSKHHIDDVMSSGDMNEDEAVPRLQRRKLDMSSDFEEMIEENEDEDDDSHFGGVAKTPAAYGAVNSHQIHHKHVMKRPGSKHQRYKFTNHYTEAKATSFTKAYWGKLTSNKLKIAPKQSEAEPTDFVRPIKICAKCNGWNTPAFYPWERVGGGYKGYLCKKCWVGIRKPPSSQGSES
ncbi:hypothetical protein HDU76_001739 [Blyttiomyces sp. JEL0837]|nr:hypothetical protein HDU76_001739 [Blyttiomyces sp. JEL0837]